MTEREKALQEVIQMVEGEAKQQRRAAKRRKCGPECDLCIEIQRTCDWIVLQIRGMK